MIPLFQVDKQQAIPSSLADKYIVPPFSVFNTRQEYWRERNRHWQALGLYSDNGRDTQLSYDNRRMCKNRDTTSNVNQLKGTSIFNPTLCEIIYKWFTVPNQVNLIFDPFAGGIARGGVAAVLGQHYVGTDICKQQIESNINNFIELSNNWYIDGCAEWYCEDCLNYELNTNADLIFTCPPYYNLEKYTDLENDLSNKKSYPEFIKSYTNVIEMCYNILKEDSFMVWVVSDVRDKQTTEYYGLVADTIKISQYAGFKLYNEIILYNDTSNLAIVSGDYINRVRKVGRQHQNVLVFYKGNTKNIKDKFGKLWED